MVLEAADGISLALPFPYMNSGTGVWKIVPAVSSLHAQTSHLRVLRIGPQLEQSGGSEGGG